MQLTDTERAVLLEDFESELSQFLLPMATKAAAQTLRELLADRAVSEPTAAGDDLDAMLDGVHPEATLSLHYISMPMADDPDPYWRAQVRIPITGFVGNRMYESTGATRREAVLGAVAKAKEALQ